MSILPIIIGPTGPQPTPPAQLLAQLIALVSTTNPGYTATLPGSLIEDISSTDVGSLTIIDQARVDTVNSLTPNGANKFLLLQLGAIYGVPPGLETNTSVSVVVFGPPGFVVAKGFTVSDGTHQYVLKDGGIIGTGGASSPLFAVSPVSGSWVVAPGTVVNIITSVPSTIQLTVTNPLAGTPAQAAESEASYRSRVLQAGLAAAQGMPRFLKTLLSLVSGVQPRLISVVQQANSWKIICGGGDPFEVAFAIFTALFDISSLVGSSLLVNSITQANPGVVTTNLNHGFATGQVINIAGALGMTAVNNTPLTITVLTQTTFSIGVNTSAFPAYTGGGAVTPNLRNVSVNINDYPDTYTVPFLNPPQQTVGVVATWNTNAPNFVSPAAVSQLATPALIAYINSLSVGVPLNVFELQATFQTAVASVLSAQLLSRMVFAVTINGVAVLPQTGTGLIFGDPESYFFSTSANIIVLQG